jgi:Phosphotransferase enzyme family
VHAFLRHLDAAGFPGAPRVLGIDDVGREVLTFIPGEVLAAGKTWHPGRPTPWPAWAQSDECVSATARLLRSFHDASASFVPPDGATWRQHDCPMLGRDEIVCHGDIGPHNTVYRDGVPVAFIDWDTIRPNHPLVEFGRAAWKYVPLGSDAYFEASDFPSRPDLARRLALFAREYGVVDRDAVAWALHQAQQRSVESSKYFAISPAEGATALRQVASELEWLQDNSATVLSVLR